MKIITSFDPALPTTGTGTIDTLGINTNEQLMLYNDSIYQFKFEFADGSVAVMPPSWNKDFILKNVAMGKVKWTITGQLAATNYPFRQVYGELYEADEHVASVNAGMQRGFALTNPGSVNVTTATQIANDGNPNGSSIIEVTPALAPGSTIIMGSDGTLTIKGDVANVLTTLLQLIPGAATNASSVILGDPNRRTEILGALLVDGVEVSTGIITGNAGLQSSVGGVQNFDSSQAANTYIAAAGAGGNINFRHGGNGGQIDFHSNPGIWLDFGSINFLAGSISRFVRTHIASVTTTAAFFNHNLGVVPDFCMVFPNDGGITTGSFSAYWDSTTMTTTQVKLQSNSASGIPVGLVAVKL